MNEKRYRAVLFDLGGTLRIALEDEPYMRHARRKMTELAGAPLQVEDFYQLVEDRYESYRRWALGGTRRLATGSSGAGGCCRTMTRSALPRSAMSCPLSTASPKAGVWWWTAGQK